MKVVGFGVACLDYLSYVDEFPKPDSKCRTKMTKQFGGGNIGNTLTAMSRLDMDCVLISKVGSDHIATVILDGYKREGIDTSLVVSGVDMPSGFTYVIVAQGTRTCIHSALPEDITPNEALACMSMLREEFMAGGEAVGLMHLDSRHTDAAQLMARFCNEQRIIASLDCEKYKPHFEGLLPLADILLTNSDFPSIHVDHVNGGGSSGDASTSTVTPFSSETDSTMPPPAPVASVEAGKGPITKADPASDAGLKKTLEGMEMLLNQGRCKVIITTLGERGCMLMTRASPTGSSEKTGREFWQGVMGEDGPRLPEEAQDKGFMIPFLDSVPVEVVEQPAWANGHRARGLRVIACGPYPIRGTDVVDSTGAGDAFIGGFLTGLCSSFTAARCLRLGTFVAAEKLRGHGARQSLPNAAALAST